MSKSWYRKWRPAKFSEVIGQDHVVRTLRHALERGSVSHAYLFTGPRGVGKTTTARLLAKGINCLSPIKSGGFDACGKCVCCKDFESGSLVDVIEIDAASNRGIDDIRAIRDKIGLSPALGSYKVYIIDEVHMLTKEAFNALLKTLEEPPAHIIMILATTEVNKVPDTILSRCQRFDFRPITDSELSIHLKKIAKAEGVELSDDGALMLAEAASGSGRDAISLFQQVSVDGEKIDAVAIADLLGFVPSNKVGKILEHCKDAEMGDGLVFIKELLDSGIDPEQCSRAVLHYISQILKKELVDGWSKDISTEKMIEASLAWSWAHKHLKMHPEPYLVLATAHVKVWSVWNNGANLPTPQRLAPQKIPTVPVVEQRIDEVKQEDPQTISVQSWNPSDDQKVFWQKFIEAAKPFNHSMAALLKDATLLGITDGEIVDLQIGVRFPFHRSRLQDVKSRQMLEEILEKLTSKKWRIQCSLVANKPKVEEPVAEDGELLDAAKAMFAE